MTDPTSSSEWTGPWEGQARPRRGIFTHRAGAHGSTSDYQRILEAQTVAEAIPAQVRSVMRLGTLLLVGAPLLLWAALQLLRSSSRDLFVQDNSGVLIGWAACMIGLALWQIMSRSERLIGLRKGVLLGALVATFVVSVAYVYAGIQAHSNARASTAERTYQLAKDCGRRCVTLVHQRADGTTVEGSDLGTPAPYARACALVQRLDGEFGFSWVRVLERSRAPQAGQLAWPVRREECFSDTPLSELPR